MGVSGSGEAITRIIGRAPESHPHAHGTFGHWVVQKKPAPPLGWVITVDAGSVWVFAGYAWCRDENGKRPWLKTGKTLNEVVAWMLQHDAEIRRLIDSSSPEPSTQ